MPIMNNEQLDPTIVNMARAIKSVETSGSQNPYQAKGGSGEYGAYQYTAPTWAADSQKYLGQAVPLEGATTAQQNQVAYGKIKDLKAQGYTPDQVASIWNSGKPDPTGNVGTNSAGVKYDTPQYVRSVTSAYNQFKNGQFPTPQPTASTVGGVPAQNQQDTQTSQDQSLGGELTGRLKNASDALNKSVSGEINPLSGILQVGGQAAGAVNDVIGKGLELIPGVKQVEGLIGKGAGKLAQTGVGQSVIGSWNDFAAKHPEAAGDIGAVGNIATLVPVFKGFGLAKEALGGAVAKTLGKEALASTIADIAPKETASSIAEGIAKRGTTKVGLLRTITPVTDPAVRSLAQTVVDNVPGFEKAANLSAKINLTQDTVDAMANDLKNQVIKNGSDRIYSIKELKSALDRIKTPLGLVREQGPVLSRVKNAALDIAKKNGGKISDLFNARKEFDSAIARQFPNLYTNPTDTPIRLAVRDIRKTMTDFAAKNLPEVELKNSLTLQSRLLDAIENMSEKVASGQAKEIGSNAIDRFVTRHPLTAGVLKHAGKYAVKNIVPAITGFELGKTL